MNSSDGLNHKSNEEWGRIIYAQSINIRNCRLLSSTCRWVTRHGIRCIVVIYTINLRHRTSSCFCYGSFSEIATTAASGTSHWKFENVHKPTMLKLAIPGSISAFIGAGVLTFIHGDYIKPFIALFLLSMGFYILYQFYLKEHMNIIHMLEI